MSDDEDDGLFNTSIFVISPEEQLYRTVEDILQSLEFSNESFLSKEQISKLKSVKLTKEHVKKDLQCTICLEYLKLNRKVKQTPCNHYFHEHCIIPWFKKHATCPNCRAIIKVKTVVSRPKHCMRLGNPRFTPRFSPSISDFFTTTMNPFRYIN